LRRIIFILFFLVYATIGFGQKANTVTFFNASFEDNELVISWSVSNPENISKFKVEKSKLSTGNFEDVCEVPFSNFRRKSETDSVTTFTFVCSDQPTENGVYFFSLKIIDNKNKELISPQLLKIGINEIPEFKLKQNNPNPFNPTTSISYEVLVPTLVKISVFTLTGQLVDVLVDGVQSQGNYSVTFNASKYSEISSGIYFYKLETEYSSDIKKMIFAK
jgi:hypothetical protein